MSAPRLAGSAGLLLVILSSFAHAQVPDLAATEGLLILRNGAVLAGRITRAGERYNVVTSDSEIRVDVAAAEMVCADFEEAYRQKLSVIRPGDVESHLRLAQWCLRHRLYDYVAKEAAKVRALDPQHPRLPLIRRELQLALRPRSQTPTASPIQQTAFTEQATDDSIADSLPPGAMERFTSTIQPLLVNSCATSGCHTSESSTAFKLVRLNSRSSLTRRVSLANLKATLAQIDHEDPAGSDLLKLPIRAHGARNAPIFTEHQIEQYRQLVAWVNDVTKPAVPESAEKTQGIDTLLQQLDGRERQAAEVPPAAEVSNDHATTGSHVPTAGASLDREPPIPGEKPSEPQKLAPETAREARSLHHDPFDPDVFNRRYSPLPKDSTSEK